MTVNWPYSWDGQYDRDCDGVSDQLETTYGINSIADFPNGTTVYGGCSATPTANDETKPTAPWTTANPMIPNAWPFDFNDDQKVTGPDLLSFGPYFGLQGVPPNAPEKRWDIDNDGDISGPDILKFGPFFALSCATAPAPVAPQPTKSWYMKTIDWGTLYNRGCAESQASHKGVVILDFGQPQHITGNLYGLRLHDGLQTVVTLSQVKNAALNFASGFWNCIPAFPSNVYLQLAVGTNNYLADTGSITFAHGSHFAEMVNDVNDYIDTVNWESQISAVGASDMETGVTEFWADGYTTRQWVDGYASTAGAPYYDYGDAGGCPHDLPLVQDFLCSCIDAYRPCTSGWNLSDKWYVSYHNPWAWPLPEVYKRNGGMAAQWQTISVYAYYSGFAPLYFVGALTQESACAATNATYCVDHTQDSPPSQAWRALWTLLNSDPRTPQTMIAGLGYTTNWSTDLNQ